MVRNLPDFALDSTIEPGYRLLPIFSFALANNRHSFGMERPGDILIELRIFKDDTRFSFSKRMGRGGVDTWSENVVKNLEIGVTKFTQRHLVELLKSGIITKGDKWHQRFENAIGHDASLKAQEKVRRLGLPEGIEIEYIERDGTSDFVLKLPSQYKERRVTFSMVIATVLIVISIAGVAWLRITSLQVATTPVPTIIPIVGTPTISPTGVITETATAIITPTAEPTQAVMAAPTEPPIVQPVAAAPTPNPVTATPSATSTPRPTRTFTPTPVRTTLACCVYVYGSDNKIYGYRAAGTTVDLYYNMQKNGKIYTGNENGDTWASLEELKCPVQDQLSLADDAGQYGHAAAWIGHEDHSTRLLHLLVQRERGAARGLFHSRSLRVRFPQSGEEWAGTDHRYELLGRR